MKKHISILIIIVFTIFIALFVSGNIGCDKIHTQEVKINDNNDIKIGILIYRFDDPFIASIRKIITNEVKVLNNNNTIKIIINMVDGKNQQDIQYDQIDTMINEGYDALVINLVDRSAASRVIDRAKQANIPIVFFNREPVQVDMARWDRIYYVGAKAEESGAIQGKMVSRYWKSNPHLDKNGDGVMQYVILEGQAGHQDAILRSKYAINTVQNDGIIVEELAKDTANWQRGEAKDKMATWLENFGSDIEFIFCNNDAMALGAVDAMKESKLISNNRLIPVVGVDAIGAAIKAIKDGEIVGTVYNDNVTQGKIIVYMAYYLALNENPANYIEDIVYGTYYWAPYYEYTEEEE